VTATTGDDTLKPISKALSAARNALDEFELKSKSLEAKRTALVTGIESTKTRIAADRARYGEAQEPGITSLIRKASELSRRAAAELAEADLLSRKQILATAEAKKLDDPTRSRDIDAAGVALANAAVALDKALADLANPALSDSYPSFGPVYPESSTGRRRALAEWISHRRNPLTARVAVNHIWLRHFHAPIVSSVFDFGINGARPTHPELLDWLAVEFMESGWNMKSLHRMIVTSQAYGLSSTSGSDHKHSQTIDPENKYLWRMNRGRMESEVVRDSLLAVSGQLDTRMGGQELENSQALTTHRRTIYYCCQPEIDGKSAFGALFDAPEPADCYRRTQSIIPQQALALTNSDLVHEASASLVANLSQTCEAAELSNQSAFVTTAFELILTRTPTDAELVSCLQFLATSENDEKSRARLREGLIRVLLNHNDFVSIR
jgi:hypothetical protein